MGTQYWSFIGDVEFTYSREKRVQLLDGSTLRVLVESLSLTSLSTFRIVFRLKHLLKSQKHK